jgi:hypothetical protein
MSEFFFQVRSDVFGVQRLNMSPSQSAVSEAEHHPVVAHQAKPAKNDLQNGAGIN